MLPENLMAALRNLACKSAGQEVPWINIADACRLTDLGMAKRTPNGWSISKAGEAALTALPWGTVHELSRYSRGRLGIMHNRL
jgi:hypothetical protein